MPAFVQTLLTGQSKTLGTTLVLTGSKTVTAGNDIFVAFACEAIGTSVGVTDNLGNTYSAVVIASSPRMVLWRAKDIAGGTLTTITLTWSIDITPRAAVSGEFSALQALGGTFGGVDFGVSAIDVLPHSSQPWQSRDLLIGAAGWMAPGSDDISADSTPSGAVEVDQAGTTGGAANSNITVALLYLLAPADSTTGDRVRALDNTSPADAAGIGAVYSRPAIESVTVGWPIPW